MNAVVLVFICAVVFFLAIICVFAAGILRPWLQCYLSGAPVMAIQIVAMHLRRTPVKLICEQRIRAKYVGVDLSCEQLERAHLQGADIKKAVDALCLAKQTERDVRWEDLIATDLSDEILRDSR
jgi:uncharacterized protein YqfA (UPF0365 family)